MLSRENNALLTQTDKGMPMGELFRRYWIPALLSEEIPGADCPPVRVRLLGEELVAFRDSEGRIGLLGEHCPHRGTSLFFGRNEACGLRCIYHGWKFDVTGKCLDTPAEPGDSNFKNKIKHTAYPTVERAGMVFAYLGPPDKMPLFPEYLWANLPEGHTYVTKSWQECNYMQGVEGECDSAHLTMLHYIFDYEKSADLPAGGTDASLFFHDAAPRYEQEETDFGVRLIATRKTRDGLDYVRVSSFVMPSYCWVPAGRREVHIYVPADDTHSWRYDLGFEVDRVVPPEDRTDRRAEQLNPDYTKMRNFANDYMIDRDVQRTKTFTGIHGFLGQDSCATESMGPIYDRSQEHLGQSDKGVIAVRRFMLDAARRLAAGEEPPHVIRDPAKNSFPHIDTGGFVVPEGKTWKEVQPHLADGESVDPAVPASAAE